MNIKGMYTFTIPIQTMFLNTRLEITNENIITILGESFFLHRCIDNEFEPLQYIHIGNGNFPPKRTDRKLGNEQLKKKCSVKVDILLKQVVLNCSFKVEDLEDTTEIGVSNGTILISHDVYNKLDSSVFRGISGDITLEYVYQFSTSFQKNAWKVYDEGSNIYYAYEENKVIRVFENNSGYRKVSSLNELQGYVGAYYYDDAGKYLYIKPIGELNSSDVIVQV